MIFFFLSDSTFTDLNEHHFWLEPRASTAITAYNELDHRVSSTPDSGITTLSRSSGTATTTTADISDNSIDKTLMNVQGNLQTNEQQFLGNIRSVSDKCLQTLASGKESKHRWKFFKRLFKSSKLSSEICDKERSIKEERKGRKIAKKLIKTKL